MEHALHPWSAYGILPVFGFANAGVSLAGFGPGMLGDPVPLGIMLGLILGKQIGVFGLVPGGGETRAGPAAGRGRAGLQIYGVALLCGVGFTMSLFIGLLAFADAPQLEAETKVGVLAGSIVCMLAAQRCCASPRSAGHGLRPARDQGSGRSMIGHWGERMVDGAGIEPATFPV